MARWSLAGNTNVVQVDWQIVGGDLCLTFRTCMAVFPGFCSSIPVSLDDDGRERLSLLSLEGPRKLEDGSVSPSVFLSIHAILVALLLVVGTRCEESRWKDYEGMACRHTFFLEMTIQML